MPKATLEHILATIPPQSRSMLDQKVSDNHLDEIAKALINWRSVCSKLGISEAEEKAIEEDNKGAYVRRYVGLSCVLFAVLVSTNSTPHLFKRLHCITSARHSHTMCATMTQHSPDPRKNRKVNELRWKCTLRPVCRRTSDCGSEMLTA